MVYAERFGVEPHRVNPPVAWWYRIGALDTARAQRRAREAVERVGLGKVDGDTRRAYDALVLALRETDAR